MTSSLIIGDPSSVARPGQRMLVRADALAFGATSIDRAGSLLAPAALGRMITTSPTPTTTPQDLIEDALEAALDMDYELAEPETGGPGWPAGAEIRDFTVGNFHYTLIFSADGSQMIDGWSVAVR